MELKIKSAKLVMKENNTISNGYDFLTKKFYPNIHQSFILRIECESGSIYETHFEHMGSKDDLEKIEKIYKEISETSLNATMYLRNKNDNIKRYSMIRLKDLRDASISFVKEKKEYNKLLDDLTKQWTGTDWSNFDYGNNLPNYTGIDIGKNKDSSLGKIIINTNPTI